MKARDANLVMNTTAAAFSAAVVVVLCTLSFSGVVQAAEKTAAAKTPAPKTESKNANSDASENEGSTVDGKKAKVLTFGAMDVEGKMRTPQLLFFLSRVKAELDSTTQLKRSFIKELKATAKEKGL